MRIKLIQAANMAEAMRRLRSELGEDALILGHRRVANGVEITAALEPVIEQREAGLPPQPMAPPLSPMLSPPRETDPERRKLNQLCQRARILRYGTLDWAKPVMLVGTPGAGKTLTAAKLATRFVQQSEAPVVITTDGDRAGAIEQLAALTRILDLDLIVAENPLMLARILANQPAGQKAIIDMAGFNPFDDDQKEVLVTHAMAADANLVWVVAAGQDCEDAVEMAQAIAALGARHMIATRLDMTRRMDGILGAAEAGDFILTDAGIGSGIADGIIALDARYMVSRINDAAAYFKTRQAA